MNTSLTTLSLSELNQCWQQARNPQQYSAGSDYALTMLQHAAAGSELAWAYYYDVYEALVHAWIGRKAEWLDQDQRFSIATDAWGRFARQMTPAKLLQFRSYAGIMQYLKLCVRSAVFDALRAEQSTGECEVELTDELICGLAHPDSDPGEEVTLSESLSEIQHAIWRALHTENERLLAYLVFFAGYQIREVVERYPSRFPCSHAVYEALRHIRRRLRHNPSLKQLLADESEVKHAS